MKILRSHILLKAFALLAVLLSSTLPAQEPQSSKAELQPFTQAELEQILAPIALYPDTVLSHLLVASTYPLEVIQAERWTQNNTDLTGSSAVEAVESKEWDPSVKALVAFPQVLKRLSDNLDWTQKLGDAFLQDEEKVIASVQSLRQRAYDSGNLDKMDKVSVSREENNIVIEPVEREVVYVPYYDTRVVYGPWYWAHNPPVYWSRPHYVSRYRGHHYSPFYWAPRVHISFGFFFSSFHWHDHHVVRIPYHHYRPRHYYDRHQIMSHQHARRWAHNPVHRRGVSYRSVTVSNRYRSDNPSQRASRAEVTAYRNYSTRNQNTSSRETQTSNRLRTQERRTGTTSTTRRNNTRVATPNRIREELRDGRISVQERNNRPQNASNSENRSQERSNGRTNSRSEPTVRTNRNNERRTRESTTTRSPAPTENTRATRQPRSEPRATNQQAEQSSRSNSREQNSSNSSRSSNRQSSERSSSSTRSSSSRSKSPSRSSSSRSKGSRDKRR